MKIRSITDVITNSSTEVFCYRLDDPEYAAIKAAIPWLDWTEFRTEADLRKVVMDLDYTEWSWTRWTQCDHGPEVSDPENDLLGDYGFREIASKKDPDQVWDFVRDGYLGMIGKAIAAFENDSISDSQGKQVSDFLSDRYKQKVLGHMGTFEVGSVLEAPLKYSSVAGESLKFKKVGPDGYELIPESVPEAYRGFITDKEWIPYVALLQTKRIYEDTKQD